ncbi:MAG: hypothetical protein Q4D38_10190, partial [Planctomycetia bacterium]|nr:hypothetical protein [Planctomycetia bacterium]
MKYVPNDPKITAYAYGELSPEECAEVEEMLAQNESARKELQQVMHKVTLFDAALMEPAPVV